jgi:poly(glycerol-phosphate) alpha-glucosyltransferase
MADPQHPPVQFPPGRQFALTWSIPDDFGGMTGALLHRSRSFVRLAGQSVDVLTFDARTDYPHVERRLRDRGDLIDGMRLINLWDWLRENDISPDAPGTLDLDRHEFAPLGADPAFGSGWRGDRELTRTRADGETILQVDYYREDGSLLASDKRDTAPGGRSLVLCDREGVPVRSWGGAWALYRFWLDVLRQRQPSFLIVDSKTVANFMATYRRKRAVIVHLVHGTHLTGDRLSAARRGTFENLGAWDSVVLLTQRQRADVEGLLGEQGNLAVIGNGREFDSTARPEPRALDSGIMLASLTARKRVDHAVRAIAAAAREHPGLALDVYGDGPEREKIAEVIAELDAPVRLRGHVAGAKDLLDGASFLLLTSSSEGLPLVLVEAMAAGCIPIAYDVPYGPADVIRHRRNGFLVPAGDPDAAARAIAELQSLSPRQVARMRRQARRTAQEFSDLAIVRRWNAELRAAASRKATAWAAEHQQRAG